MKRESFLLLGVLGVFLIALSPTLFSDGMFVDGLVYASISRNLAEGSGTLWNLRYTDFMYQQFNEHPPFAIYLQSILFKVFGDQLWVERLFGLLSLLGIIGSMMAIWRSAGYSREKVWFPILLLLTCPLTIWCISNNLLENTMAVFTLLSVWCGLRFWNNGKYLWLVVAALFCVLSFFTKGFTGLYTLVTPIVLGIVWHFKKLGTLKKAVVGQFVLLLSFLTLLALFFVAVPDSFDAIQRYFNRQILNSLENIKTVNSRFYIVGKMFTELIAAIVVIALLLFWGRKEARKEQKSLSELYGGQSRELSSKVLSLLLIGLSGVLPMVISEKQSGFYLFTTLPLFVLGISGLTYPVLSLFQERILNSFKYLKTIAISLLVIGIVLNVFYSRQPGRDYDKLDLVSGIGEHVKEGESILVESYLWHNWGFHAYLQRYLKVGVTDKMNLAGDWYISESLVHKDGYTLRWQSKKQKYFLYRRQ